VSELATAIGARLKKAREGMGLTQEQVANVLGVTRVEVSYYENGRREISLGKLARLATLYGYNAEYFLRAEDAADNDVAIAFRAEELSSDDLEIVAWARGLVSDMARLDALLKEGGR
jgi:transcriptional regulator with XRE-family HTH domain